MSDEDEQKTSNHRPAAEGPVERSVMALVPKRTEILLYYETIETRRQPSVLVGECCGKCRYWISTEETHEYDEGECRRCPPQITPDRDGRSSPGDWPNTLDFQWCGEYRERHNG